MAETAKKSLIPRLLEGKGRSHDYKKSSQASGKPALVWALVKGRFGRLVLVNMLTLLFCLPAIAIIVWRSLAIGTQGIVGPYGSGLGVGYPALPDTTGLYPHMIFMNDILFFVLFIPAALVAAVGAAGLAYVIGNLLRTEGIFVMKDYWRGVKQNFGGVAISFTLFSLVLFAAQSVNNLADWFASVGEPGFEGLIASKIIGWVIVALLVPVCLWMVPLTNQYKLNGFGLLRAGFLVAFRLFPLSVLFSALSLWPFFLALFTSGFWQIIGDALVMILAFSYAMLVFCAFSSWVFERYGLESVAPALDPNPKKRGKAPLKAPQKAAQKTPAKAPSEEKAPLPADEARALLSQEKSKLIGCSMRPLSDGEEVYALSPSFSRGDLQKLDESKEAVAEGAKAYEKAHEGEERYKKYNEQFASREKAIDDGGKRKRVRPPKMLK